MHLLELCVCTSMNYVEKKTLKVLLKLVIFLFVCYSNKIHVSMAPSSDATSFATTDFIY